MATNLVPVHNPTVAAQIHPRSTMRDSQSSVESNYTLNVNKALSKKLEATQRKQNIEYVFKEGGIAMTADAVTFELLRLATIQYFEQLEGQAHIRKVDDKTRNSHCSVYHQSQTPSGKLYHQYMYTTTS
jgi:hypothetical protein